MTPERWQQIVEVLDHAREHPTGEQPAFLNQACGDDTSLRDEVASLLELDDKPAFLDQPVLSVHGRDPDLGQQVGSYEIVDLLGRGGMGAVYLARRRDDYRQRVALKLIKRGMDSDEIVRRFQNERQILANLDHPNIARLLDGGTSADGRPFLVMEYVEGEPIDRYCDRRKLSTRARLKLFLDVCSAVQLSHQKLVVHRDLKPGNILVNAAGVPKLLDFGIAKLLEPEPAFRTLATLPEQRPMTLRYASPEQVRGEVVATASDTYALGVLLYQLLTGHHPNDLEDSRTGSTAEVIRRICEHEPQRPSTAIRGHKTYGQGENVVHLTPELISSMRDGDPRRLGRRLKGDVDAIVLKALRKEPSQRYGSVEQLAEDIRRFLDGRPVTARKGTFTYRTAKFVRRNRLALAVFLLILGFSISTTMLWREAVQESRRADRLLELVRAFSAFSDPRRSESARGTLEYVTRLLNEVLKEDPQEWGEFLKNLGNIYRSLGLYDEARGLMETSFEVLKRQYPGDHHLLAEGINNLAVLSFDIGEYEIAEEQLREALAMRQRLGQDETLTVKTLNNLASILMNRGEFTEAEKLYRQGLEIRKRNSGTRDLDVSTSLRSLANLLYIQGDAAQAEPLLREALDIRLDHFKRRDARVAAVLDKLGSVRLALGDVHEAETLFSEALDIQREIFGGGHPLVAHTQSNLAALYLQRAESPEETDAAGDLLQTALATLVRTKPVDDWEIARVRSLTGAYLTRQGRYAEAEPLLIDSHQVLRETRGEEAIYTRAAHERITELYQAWGRPAPIEP